jgi:hypothetical protein
MRQPTVEVVVVNWRRPRNVETIISALRNQSFECTVTICDYPPSDEFALRPPALLDAHRVIRWNRNIGPYGRYGPLGLFDHTYTFFLDDDMMPGRHAVEHFLAAAEGLPDFGVLGQFGRRITGDHYNIDEVPRDGGFTDVDVIVRAYFVKTVNLHLLPQFRWQLMPDTSEFVEDDLLLCFAMQHLGRLPCLLTPWSDDPETLVNRAELPQEHALSRRPHHVESRTRIVRRAMDLGWSPVVRRLEHVQHAPPPGQPGR